MPELKPEHKELAAHIRACVDNLNKVLKLAYEEDLYCEFDFRNEERACITSIGHEGRMHIKRAPAHLSVGRILFPLDDQS